MNPYDAILDVMDKMESVKNRLVSEGKADLAGRMGNLISDAELVYNGLCGKGDFQ